MPVFFTHSQPIILMKREITYYSHFHYEAELIYVVSGRYRVISKGVTYDLGEGDIWLGFPFDEHSYVDIGDNVTMLAIFAPEHLGAVGRLLCTRRPGRPVVNISEFPPGFGDGLVRVAQMWMALNKRNESAVRNYENELLDSRYIGSVTTRETVLAYLSAAIGELLGAMENYENAISNALGGAMYHIVSADERAARARAVCSDRGRRVREQNRPREIILMSIIPRGPFMFSLV